MSLPGSVLGSECFCVTSGNVSVEILVESIFGKRFDALRLEAIASRLEAIALGASLLL